MCIENKIDFLDPAFRLRTSPVSPSAETTPSRPASNADAVSECLIDVREALFNDRAQGSIGQIQLPLDRITTLHGILWDLDPKILIPSNPLFPPAGTPDDFYRGIRTVLDRHPLVRFAEVRISGTGLHLILWMDPPVELRLSGDQRRWNLIVKAIQRSLPVDPDMPAMTAVSRPLGSINSRNGRAVRTLVAGKPVTPAEVERFMASFVKSPFRHIATTLLGQDRVEPCPLCNVTGTRLDTLDFAGMCYGSCGKIKVDTLMDAIYSPRTASTADFISSKGNEPNDKSVL